MSGSNLSAFALSELVGEGGLIQTGPFGSQLHSHDFSADGSYAVAMPNNMIGGRIDLSKADRISSEIAQRLKKHQARPFDILLSRRGDIGRGAFIGPGCGPVICGTGSLLVRLTSEWVDPYYAFLYLTDGPGAASLRGAAVGSTMPNINSKIAAELRLELPALYVQRKIAAILSAYDDLIENNRRRIEILEETARAIYREWFEARRFPGSRDVAPAGDELPVGWRRVRVGDIVELKYGKALAASSRNPGPIRVMSSAGAVGWHDQELASGPGIVVGRKGNVGSIHWAHGPFWVIDTAYFVQSDLPLSFLFHALETLEFRNTHAAVPGLNRDDVYMQTMVVPDTNTLNRFSAIATQSFEMLNTLELHSANLAAQRDLLLPKLISGKLDVSDLDIDTSRIEEQENLWRESTSV
jgi:type I restriction enzyme S subunit